MRNRLLLALPVVGLLASAACGPDATPQPQPPVTPSATPDASAAVTPPSGPPRASIDESILDKSVDACEDFYQYACGGWLKSTPIPEDEAAWARSFSVIHDKNEATLKAILEKNMATPGDEPYSKQLGDYYASCMDSDGIDKRGMDDIKDELARIEAIKDLKGLTKAIAHLHAVGAVERPDRREPSDDEEGRERGDPDREAQAERSLERHAAQHLREEPGEIHGADRRNARLVARKDRPEFDRGPTRFELHELHRFTFFFGLLVFSGIGASLCGAFRFAHAASISSSARRTSVRAPSTSPPRMISTTNS